MVEGSGMNVGSRGYDIIDYSGTCSISGVAFNRALHLLKNNQVIAREDFVRFCFEFLSYKFGLTEINNVALKWSEDEWEYPNTKVYRSDISHDILAASNVLKEFHTNFKKSDAEKISY